MRYSGRNNLFASCSQEPGDGNKPCLTFDTICQFINSVWGEFYDCTRRFGREKGKENSLFSFLPSNRKPIRKWVPISILNTWTVETVYLRPPFSGFNLATFHPFLPSPKPNGWSFISLCPTHMLSRVYPFVFFCFFFPCISHLFWSKTKKYKSRINECQHKPVSTDLGGFPYLA